MGLGEACRAFFLSWKDVQRPRWRRTKRLLGDGEAMVGDSTLFGHPGTSSKSVVGTIVRRGLTRRAPARLRNTRRGNDRVRREADRPRCPDNRRLGQGRRGMAPQILIGGQRGDSKDGAERQTSEDAEDARRRRATRACSSVCAVPGGKSSRRNFFPTALPRLAPFDLVPYRIFFLGRRGVGPWPGRSDPESNYGIRGGVAWWPRFRANVAARRNIIHSHAAGEDPRPAPRLRGDYGGRASSNVTGKNPTIASIFCEWLGVGPDGPHRIPLSLAIPVLSR